MAVLPRVTAKRIKSAATTDVFPDQAVSVNTVRQILVVLPVRVVAAEHVFMDQVVLVLIARTIPTALDLAERLVVVITVFTVQVAPVRLISIVLTTGKVVVMDLAITRMFVMMILPPASLLV